MDKWSNTADRLWQAILSRVRELRSEDETLQTIANTLGLKSRAIVGHWLSGVRKANGAPFADLMNYTERLGIDYRHYFPGGEPPVQAPSLDCATCRKLLAKEKELQKALKEVERLKLELAGAQGEVRALERQLDRRGEAGRQAGDLPGEQKAAV